MNSDGTVTVFCGKVDLGQGLRIAIRQIAGEELGIGVDMIQYVEGDTALTPDQGRTSGSNGIQRGGMQINVQVLVHWLKDAPLRPAPIAARAPRQAAASTSPARARWSAKCAASIRASLRG